MRPDVEMKLQMRFLIDFFLSVLSVEFSHKFNQAPERGNETNKFTGMEIELTAIAFTDKHCAAAPRRLSLGF